MTLAVAPSLDVLTGIYDAIMNDTNITDLLGEWEEGPSVHTRRPVPDDAAMPQVLIGPIVTRTSIADGLNYYHPTVEIDVITYGFQPDDYRKVEEVAEMIHAKFHRQRGSFAIENYELTDIQCSGPAPAPTDDESEVARVVTLTIRASAAA